MFSYVDLLVPANKCEVKTEVDAQERAWIAPWPGGLSMLRPLVFAITTKDALLLSLTLLGIFPFLTLSYLYICFLHLWACLLLCSYKYLIRLLGDILNETGIDAFTTISLPSPHPLYSWLFPLFLVLPYSLVLTALLLTRSASAFSPFPVSFCQTCLSSFLSSSWQTSGLPCVCWNHRCAHTPPPAAEMPRTWKRPGMLGGQKRNETCAYTEPIDDGSTCVQCYQESDLFQSRVLYCIHFSQ